MTEIPARVRELLPLRPAAFHILLVLAEGERHGYSIKQEVEQRTGGVIRMGPGTLYESIQRLVENGLIAESSRRPPPQNDQAQRRYYRLSPFGKRVLRAEVARLGELVDGARATLSGAKPA